MMRYRFFLILVWLTVATSLCQANPPRVVTRLASEAALKQALDTFANGTGDVTNILLIAKGWPTSISIDHTNGHYALQIVLDSSTVAQRTPGVTVIYSQEEPASTLPKKVFVSPQGRERLDAWAVKEAHHHEVGYFVVNGPAGLEAYTSLFEVTLNTPAEIEAMIHFVIHDIFASPATSYTMVSTYRADAITGPGK